MLTAASETKLKNIINGSTADDQTKQLLIRIIDELAVMSPASAGQVVGLADDTLVGTTETITIKNGIITSIASN